MREVVLVIEQKNGKESYETVAATVKWCELLCDSGQHDKSIKISMEVIQRIKMLFP